MSNRIAPSVKFVRSLDGKYYLLREAADILGINHRILRNFKIDKIYEPSFFAYLGKVKIYLYTDEDIARIRNYLDEQKAIYPISEEQREQNKGRPPKWTKEQRKARQRKFSQVHYYKKMAQRHLDAGEHARAEKAMKKAREIQKALRDEDIEQIRKSNG